MMNGRRIAWLVVLVVVVVLPLALAEQPQSDDHGMTAAAVAALDAVGTASAEPVQFDFEVDDRRDWHYVPRRRPGVALGDLTAEQNATIGRLLDTTFSPSGVDKVWGIIELEAILGRIEGNAAWRDPGLYHLSFFGDPDPQQLWGWRLEGHHLSLNITSVPELGTAMTPMFLGANPATVPDGSRAGWRILGAEEDLARALLLDLDLTQLERTILSNRAPKDIVTGAVRRLTMPDPEGLPAAAMSERQKRQLVELIETYVRNLQPADADLYLDRIFAGGIDDIHFAWAGGARPGQPHYYRIHGPAVWIEYDNTQNGANHIHSVWRDPTRDFGDDLLRRHYGESGHHREH